MKQPIRILIVDDHQRSRSGLRALLATSQEVEVVGEATNGQEAIRLVEAYQPDVVLMDVQMPVMDGLEASRQIKRRWPTVKVILLTVYNAHRAKALATGADIFLAKGCPMETLWAAILNPGQSLCAAPV